MFIDGLEKVAVTSKLYQKILEAKPQLAPKAVSKQLREKLHRLRSGLQGDSKKMDLRRKALKDAIESESEKLGSMLPGPRGGAKPMSHPTRVTPTSKPLNPVMGLKGLTGAPAKVAPFSSGLVTRKAIQRLHK